MHQWNPLTESKHGFQWFCQGTQMPNPKRFRGLLDPDPEQRCWQAHEHRYI